jgi:hypothetical protein
MVSGRSWTIKWNTLVSFNSNVVVAGSSYKYNLVSPIPGHYSSLYNQIVTGGAWQIDVLYWLFKGNYKFTIQPYNPSTGVSYPSKFQFSNRS